MSLDVKPGLVIPDEELEYKATTGGGPGGQHVNKTATRITVSFDVAASPTLGEEDRARILERLATRINKEGVLSVTAQSERSQSANRERATERLAELLREALARQKKRRKTRVPRSAVRKRLEGKRQRSDVKRQRRGDHGD